MGESNRKDKFSRDTKESVPARATLPMSAPVAPVVASVPPPAPLPTQLDEADALRLENFQLQLDKLQLQANQVVAAKQEFSGVLVNKYRIDVAHDAIDLDKRVIQRGVK